LDRITKYSYKLSAEFYVNFSLADFTDGYHFLISDILIVMIIESKSVQNRVFSQMKNSPL